MINSRAVPERVIRRRDFSLGLHLIDVILFL